MKKKFISETELINDSFRLAVKIFNSGFRPNFLVGLWRGGSTVGIYVQECLQHLGVKTDHISIRTSYEGAPNYQAMISSERGIGVHGLQYLLENLNYDDKLLIVDDVFSSGLSIDAVINRLSQRTKRNMPHDCRVAVPWFKPDRNCTVREPDFFISTTDDWLVLPYEMAGLSHDEILKNKPGLSSILDEIDLSGRYDL
ncbi:MAG: hypoxanthine phosphoribosyltransferase [Porticoccaceae bacterium]|nr:hypoxanthine phosphoribosyltransferase [Porticoccaceae bacterium]